MGEGLFKLHTNINPFEQVPTFSAELKKIEEENQAKEWRKI